MGLFDQDPEFKVDRLTSAMLQFPIRAGTFYLQHAACVSPADAITGNPRYIEMVMPFTPPPDRASYILIDDGRDLLGSGISTETFPPCNQFTIQGEAFSRAVREGGSVPVPLTDAIKNMAVIEAIVRSEPNQAGGKRPSLRGAVACQIYFSQFSTLIPSNPRPSPRSLNRFLTRLRVT